MIIGRFINGYFRDQISDSMGCERLIVIFEAFELINRWHHSVRKFDNFRGVVETLMKHIPGWLEIREGNR